MSVHRIYFPDLPGPGAAVWIEGDEAHHAARVKRLAHGDTLELRDGRGGIASASVGALTKRGSEWAMQVHVERVDRIARERPRLTVAASAPKGDRLTEMIDGLVQVGTHAWSPLIAERTVVEPREGKLSRLSRVVIEAMKQCGAPWAMEIGPASTLDAFLHTTGVVVLADSAGPAYRATGAESVTLLIGPEGGWTPGELARAQGAGVRTASFGRHVMRTEVAAVVCAGIVLSAEAACVTTA